MIKVRKANDTLIYGAFEDLLPKHEALFVYTRTMNDEQFLVVLNMSDDEQVLDLESAGDFKSPADFTKVIGNYTDSTIATSGKVKAWECALFRV